MVTLACKQALPEFVLVKLVLRKKLKPSLHCFIEGIQNFKEVNFLASLFAKYQMRSFLLALTGFDELEDCDSSCRIHLLYWSCFKTA